MASKKTKKAVLTLPRAVVEHLNRMMQKNTDDIDRYATVASWTVKFDDGVEADVKVCSSDYGDPLWCEAVLFKDGSEVCCSEVECELDGTWELGYEGVLYIINVVKGE